MSNIWLKTELRVILLDLNPVQYRNKDAVSNIWLRTELRVILLDLNPVQYRNKE